MSVLLLRVASTVPVPSLYTKSIEPVTLMLFTVGSAGMVIGRSSVPARLAEGVVSRVKSILDKLSLLKPGREKGLSMEASSLKSVALRSREMLKGRSLMLLASSFMISARAPVPVVSFTLKVERNSTPFTTPVMPAIGMLLSAKSATTMAESEKLRLLNTVRSLSILDKVKVSLTLIPKAAPQVPLLS